jgi:lipopolysaccharide transport system ATP-binding protein
MPAIKFEHVSKRYRIGSGRGSLRDAVPDLFRRFTGRGSDQRSANEFIWALKDVSFEVEEGEIIGIIGPNGAGKTTILKLLSKITKPTSGDTQVRGRISALIELGAGFHPDLTGRENIYLNGSILGLKKTEIDERFDSIVEFAGLERFIDTPVKRYSSGMYVRLGFAVAVHVDPEILLIDEVLSVGDKTFQAKSLDRIRQMMDRVKAVIFVSHHLPSIGGLCQRAILMDGGKLIMDGRAEDVIHEYEKRVSDNSMDSLPYKSVRGSYAIGGGRISNVRFLDDSGRETKEFCFDEPIRVAFEYEFEREFEDVTFGVVAYRYDGVKCFGVLSHLDVNQCAFGRKGAVELRIAGPGLAPGLYVFDVQGRSVSINHPYCTHREKQVVIKPAGEYISPFAGVYVPSGREWRFLPAGEDSNLKETPIGEGADCV